MKFKFFNLENVYYELDKEAIKFAENLKVLIMESNYYLRENFYEEYEDLKKEIGKFLLEDRELAEDDVFKHNVLLGFLEKKPDKSVTSKYYVNKSYYDYSEEDLERYILDLIVSSDLQLSGIYGTGETQSFTHDDGVIKKKMIYEEKNNRLYIYAYYGYIFK